MSEPGRPRLTVVIPAYNQARYLAGAIRSVLNQQADGRGLEDCEILVIDDGSSDHTRDVAHSFGERVRYIWQENQGLAGARNTGIRHARGELVALLDSDDEWLPNYLGEMTALAETHPQAAVFYCPVLYMDPEGKPLPQRSQAYGLATKELYWKLLRANFLVPSTILLRREAVCAAGLFDPAFRRLQDWELWLRMLRDGFQFVEAPQHLVRYRLHDASLSTDPRGGQRAARALVEKLFGAEDEAPLESWSSEKRRAFGGMYRYHALSSVQYASDWEASSGYLAQALQADPSLAEDMDLFYELALGSQPIGYRGVHPGVDVEANVVQLQAAVQTALEQMQPAPRAELQRKIWTAVNRAAGTLAYNLGQYRASRRLLVRALRLQPSLLGQRSVASAVVKSWLKPASGGRE
jgi:glycosyltransferase involved in cell wall biosynthesis